MILQVQALKSSCLLLVGATCWSSVWRVAEAFLVLSQLPADRHCRIPRDGLAASTIGGDDITSLRPDQSFTRIDPLVARVFFDEQENDEEEMSSSFSYFGSTTSMVMDASRGVPIWKAALTKGRLPIDADFVVGNDKWRWPPQPLYDAIYDAMVQMQLPRLALRHPETVSLILRSVLRTTLKYSQRLEEAKQDAEEEDEYDYNDMDYFYSQQDQEEETEEDSYSMFEYAPDDGPESVAREVGQQFIKQWDPVVNGMSILDNLFGYNHHLLQGESEDNDEEHGTAGSPMGFGIDDGVWTLTGWQQIPALQRELKNLSELTQLVKSLGRRPTIENSDRIHKFKPRRPDSNGGPGAEFDPTLRESVSGITFSGSLSEMLPSEAVLLCGSSPVLRNLFLARWAESKLLSYEMSGYQDIPSIPRTRPLHQKRLPSAPGGPIIVCLDTSWSMSGSRETLSKAVVLACVKQAHHQGRDCQVVAFSTERQVIEAGIITADPQGIQRLLWFLSHSFGGGTDVTGALKYAMSFLDDSTEKTDLLAAADILLVTDGEIPDPPVPNDVMASLDHLKLKRGVEIHGLLIGKSESKPLSRLCTHTHDFLNKGIGLSVQPESNNHYSKLQSRARRRIGTDMYVTRKPMYEKGRFSTALFAARKAFYDEDEYVRKGKTLKKNKGRYTRDDDGGEQLEQEDQVMSSDFSDYVQNALGKLQEAATLMADIKEWTPDELQSERQQNGSCWDLHKQLDVAVFQVEDGLVERGEDARLVVLAMIASEHILLLGSPGTAKSVLGQRLAKLCNGAFFQRLLTRFTTPEELFGPLSLRSLEQDEYKRVTKGFLPTSDVAFLDEIFKANSAILNTLLTILNERRFDNSGIQEKCPIRCVVGASNELPESDELFALFDRFLIRKEVKPVSDEGLLKLLSMSNPGPLSTNGTPEVVNDPQDPIWQNLDNAMATLSSAAETVTMDIEACELMKDLRTFLRDENNIQISDRRLVKTSRLMKLCAASDGRQKVDTIDFLVTQHCFWNEPEQRSMIREWLWENLTPLDRDAGDSVTQLRFLLNNLRQEILSTLRNTGGLLDTSQGAKVQDISTLDDLREEAHRIASLSQEQFDRLARHLELLRSDDFTWIDPDDVDAMKQLLLPRGELIWPKIKNLTIDAYALCMALSDGPSSPPNEVREDVIEILWSNDVESEREFTQMELEMSMKEAKAKYDIDKFRQWKRAQKKGRP